MMIIKMEECLIVANDIPQICYDDMNGQEARLEIAVRMLCICQRAWRGEIVSVVTHLWWLTSE